MPSFDLNWYLKIGGVMAALGVVSLVSGVVRRLKNKLFKAT